MLTEKHIMAYLGPSPHPEHVPPVEGVLERRAEPSIRAADLQHRLLHLLHFSLGQAFNGAKFLLCDHLNSSDGTNSGGFKFLNVGHIDSV